MSKTLKECQDEVHAWVGQRVPAYWNPHQIYTRLGSEVGELGKEINHEFGPLKKKPDEKPSSIEEESGDIIFTVICLLNSKGLSLDKAFRLAMAKCYGRDKDRFERVAQKIEVTGVCPGCSSYIPRGFYACDGDGSHSAVARGERG